ncbi:tRNA (adenosine(37)-N6)-threonylcarbamoyltransferase complex dimerization subunit type 1 TsaB [Solemya velum gill symbiont]|uniref:tRNA (adenosine(37)-N6)-threonylcarbamoyltransferase complex dimerization subunit type 1 TsaB n=1 Tax=Solemya velum gill symbiont TaxID=2340 RepID=UPI0009972AE0|nr:tRNA (adenosine(37)-N6)-threonylcarbamoyltransferase complex dimerization subunit type 1 TsaB [Solemya velum gill symbiont]OOY99123.1 tRNA (adenosine(37)-N6)-threonylcarbamoyltransferase complex dimerization subunit type 1 TsaB [Solemya velum gill symbiont]OOZ00341.1 tRNA (adenosine(37)-N6)-threonylcarbamoyltransferase complex dimerization subunit type 1 TsaB [Solemya velum gill symbiont]OOZ03596.1 tRNA (adenosine(37)-N6)-threonylcarbamoyltransferase complex dimerization subunit type 1 TsaB [
MKLLAIETSEIACSAALWMNGEVSERFDLVPRRHSELLLPMIDEVLADTGVVKSQLDAIAFSRGPGSFTGVRIATGVAQGLGFALDCPLVPVSTLAGFAQGCYRRLQSARVAVALDARMQEVYWGAYRSDDNGVMRLSGEERCCAPAEVNLDESDWSACGSGWEAYSTDLKKACDGQLGQYDEEPHCHAKDIAMLAATLLREDGGVPAEQAMPVYLRNQVAHVKA